MVAMQRVKVYRLNAEGQWDDKGTGHVSVEVMEVGPLWDGLVSCAAAWALSVSAAA